MSVDYCAINLMSCIAVVIGDSSILGCCLIYYQIALAKSCNNFQMFQQLDNRVHQVTLIIQAVNFSHHELNQAYSTLLECSRTMLLLELLQYLVHSIIRMRCFLLSELSMPNNILDYEFFILFAHQILFVSCL